MTKKDDLIKKIRRDLEKSGYPLEINVMKLLMQFDWNIIPQHYYVDPDEDKGRSLDFYCVKRVEIKSPYLDALRFILLIECKKTAKNWVFFVTSKPFSEKKLLGFVEYYAKMHITSKEPGISIDEALKYSHYLNYNKVAINHYIPFKSEGQKDNLYEAIQQVLKALIDDRNYLEENYDIPTNYLCSFYFPIIVTDRQMFLYDIETDEISYADQVLYFRSGISRWLEPFLIDITTFKEAPALLKEINYEIMKIKECFQ